MKTFNSATATIHIQNNRVTKEFYKKDPISTRIGYNKSIYEWFTHYNSIKNMFDYPIDVFEYNEDRIVMEYVEGKSLEEVIVHPSTTISEVDYYTAQYLDLIKMFYEYASNSSDEFIFFHYDVSWANIIVNKNNQLKLIDPDSFIFQKFYNFNPMRQGLSTLYKIFDSKIDKLPYYYDMEKKV
tara:strand:+ start:3399 stop:3947 length:549 start_codon:yes stop_codon:yes gene_type:complete